MTTILRQTGKLSFSLLFILSLSVAGMVAVAQPAAPQGNQAANQQKGAKKVPKGSKGFAGYARHDSSDKLITGGGTRSGDPYESAIDRGTIAYEEGKYKEATDAFKEATTLKPDAFLAHYSLGVAYEALSMYKEAAEAYKRAVTLNPGMDHPKADLLAFYNLGNIYAGGGQHKEALEMYQQVIRRDANLWMVHYNTGLSYAAIGQQKEAIDSFTKALSLKPDRDVELIHYNLGLAYGNDEQLEKAAEAFKQALKLKSDYAEARYNLGVVYYMLNNESALIEQQKILQTTKPEMASELAKLIGK